MPPIVTARPVSMDDHASIFVSGIIDFSFSIAMMFLESFLASQRKLTAKDRKTIQDCMKIVRKFLPDR